MLIMGKGENDQQGEMTNFRSRIPRLRNWTIELNQGWKLQLNVKEANKKEAVGKVSFSKCQELDMQEHTQLVRVLVGLKMNLMGAVKWI